MYETQIHLHIHKDIFWIHIVFQISKTNILRIAINSQVLRTLEYIHVVFLYVFKAVNIIL